VTFDTAGSFHRHFKDALAEAEAKTPYPLADWPYAGRRSPKRQVEWWEENGPALCQKYIDWYEANDDITVWITPDDKPAIELDLTASFGRVPVRVIIDQVLKAGSALIITDLKSGAKTPDSMTQLGIGASVLELTYGIRPRYGSFWMHKLDEPFRPFELGGYQYSVEFLSDQIGMFDRAERSGIYVANPGQRCKRCGVAQHCPAMGVRPE